MQTGGYSMQGQLTKQGLFGNEAPFKTAISKSIVPSMFFRPVIQENNDKYYSPSGYNSQEDLMQWLRIPDLSIIERKWGIQLPSQFEFHVHDHCQISQNIFGEILYIVNGTTITLTRNDILFINPNTPHTWIAQHGTECSSAAYYPHMLNLNNYSLRFLPYIQILYSQRFPFIYLRENDPYFNRICSILQDIHEINDRREMGFDAILHNRVVDLSIVLTLMLINKGELDVSEDRDTTLQRAIEYINENFKNNISVKTVADIIGLNPAYFSHFFKNKLGISCKKFINIKRIENAATMLINSNLSILEIMYDSGFSSTSAFYNSFLEHYKISPAKYRRFFVETTPNLSMPNL